MAKKPAKTAQPSQRQPRMMTIRMIVTDSGEEGKEPEVIHEVLVDGRPVEVALAVVAVGEMPMMVRSGGEGWTGTRALGRALRVMADNMYDQVLGGMSSVLDRVYADLQVRQHNAKQADQQPPAPPAPEIPSNSE